MRHPERLAIAAPEPRLGRGQVLLAVLVVMLAATIANAEPRRVLVVDGDAELVHAIETSLRPWKLVVVADGGQQIDPALVATRASDAKAQYIVWRDRGEMVVYDRERGVTERQPTRTGPLDPVAAAGAALTVKTMLRLPAPLPEETAEPAAASAIGVGLTPSPVEDQVNRLRVTVGFGVNTAAALRGSVGAMWRPTRYAFRIGIGAELASADVDASGYAGTARDYAGFALASWSWPAGPLEVEPSIGGGVIYDVVDAAKSNEKMVNGSAILPFVRMGATAWWYAGDWGLGLTAGVDVLFGTPTYTKDPGKAVVYEVPSTVGVIALVAAWRR